MAKYGVTFPPYMHTRFSNNTAKTLAYVTFLRNRLRTVLDSLNDGANFKVSEILKWQGLDSTEGEFMFLVEFRDGSGNPTGPQILFGYPWSDSNARQYYRYANNNGTTSGTYISYSTTFTPTSSYDYSPVFFYAPKGGTREFRMTFTHSGGTSTVTTGDIFTNSTDTRRAEVITVHSQTDCTFKMLRGGRFRSGDTGMVNLTTSGTFAWASEVWRTFFDLGWQKTTIQAVSYDAFDELTLENGDGTTVVTEANTSTASPYSAISTWIPQVGTSTDFVFYKGYISQAFAVDAYGFTTISTIFDSTKKYFCSYYSDGPLTGSVYNFWIAGDIVKCANASAVYVDGSFSWYQTFSRQYCMTYSSHWLQTRYSVYGGGGASASDWSIRGHTNFTLENSPAPDGTYPEDFMYIYNTNEAKGWFDPDLIRVQGAYVYHHGLITKRSGSNHAIRLNNYVATPWSTDLIPMLNSWNYTGTEFPSGTAF